MMALIIDRRLNPGGKGLQNRERFMRRNKRAIQEAARKMLREGSIKEIAKDKPKRLRPRLDRGTHEPKFRHGGKGGSIEHVLPGNKKFSPGDVIPRPGGGGSGSKGSPDGGGEDPFFFEVSQKEFLDIIFEGMELPDRVKKMLTGEEEFERHRAGITTTGPPNKRDLIRTLKNAKARRRAFRAPKRRKVRKLENRREEILRALALSRDKDEIKKLEEELNDIENAIRSLTRAIRAVPFLDESDVRYRQYDNVPKPVSKAVMFCLLDASGSMDEQKKELAKRFFLLLYLFLVRNYKRVEVVFIWHTQYAKEVEEEEFFHSRETGGTIVSTALHLMREIIDKRFSLSEWNIYGCQVSDGDDWADDLLEAQKTLAEKILPATQYYAYIEVKSSMHGQNTWSGASGERESDLWRHYHAVKERFQNFAMAVIKSAEDVYPTLRKLFESGRKKRRTQ